MPPGLPEQPAQLTSVPGSIVQVFEQQVERFSDRAAVFDSERTLNYSALNVAANQLAGNIFSRLGARPELVPYLLGQKVNSLQALWGILKCGKGLVVLDPTFTPQNLRAILLNSDARILVTDTEHLPLALELIQATSVEILNLDAMQAGNSENLNLNISPGAYAVAIYTSGSTGQAKGLLRTFQTVLYRHPIDSEYQETDRVMLPGLLNYSQNQHTMFTTMRAGACLGLYDIRLTGGSDLTAWIEAQRITGLVLTPSLFRSSFGALPAGKIFPRVRFLQLGGEATTKRDLEIFKRCFLPGAWGVTKFASTETGLISKYKFDHATQLETAIMPVGRVIAGKAILLLDEQGESVPAGEIGEIVVRAKAFNTQYWKITEVENEKLRPDPDDSSKSLFYTGDLGRFRADGILEHHGRKDAMLKIRGNRVQLEVIDAALRGLDGVLDAVTVAHDSAARGKLLVSYLAVPDAKKWSIAKFKQDLAARLEQHMIPSTFIRLDELPRTSTGKLARKELPDPTDARPELDSPFVAPQTATEKRVAQIWQKSLELNRVGLHDNFFELGGDSLAALEMTLAVEKATGESFPRSFLSKPTISNLVELLGTKPTETPAPESLGLLRRPKNSRARGRLMGYVARLRRLNPSKIVQRLFYGYLDSKTFLEARAWILRWSASTLAQKLFYRKHTLLLSDLVRDLGNSLSPSDDVIRMSIANNIFSGLYRHLVYTRAYKGRGVAALKRSPSKYWRSFAEQVDFEKAATGAEILLLNGVEHVLRARQAEKGLIFLSFHAISDTVPFSVASQRMGMEIPIVSFKLALQESQQWAEREDLAENIVSTLNVNLAMDAVEQLRRNGSIHLIADTQDTSGNVLTLEVGRRIYDVKYGFAEFALITGARVIPYFCGYLGDGRPYIEFCEPLEPADGDRSAQSENLVRGYTAFVNRVWAQHPEIIQWKDIEKHLARPLAGG